MITATGLIWLGCIAVFVLGLCIGTGAAQDWDRGYLLRAKRAEAALEALRCEWEQARPVPAVRYVASQPDPVMQPAQIVHVHLPPQPGWPRPPVIDAQIVPALTTGQR